MARIWEVFRTVHFRLGAGVPRVHLRRAVPGNDELAIYSKNVRPERPPPDGDSGLVSDVTVLNRIADSLRAWAATSSSSSSWATSGRQIWASSSANSNAAWPSRWTSARDRAHAGQHRSTVVDPHDQRTPIGILRDADAAMYVTKSTRRRAIIGSAASSALRHDAGIDAVEQLVRGRNGIRSEGRRTPR